MCGSHNYTKDLNVQNLHSFIMKGKTNSRENVIIDHGFVTQNGEPYCTLIDFFNISFVNITTMTMRCPAINLKESHITVKSSDLYGYSGSKKTLSFINITSKGSQAKLDNCAFKQNCVITSNFSDGIIVNNSTFQSYRHEINFIIVALSSVVTLTGNMNFTDSVTGTALFLESTHPDIHNSLLNISTGATVYFVNLVTCKYSYCVWGAVYGENGMVHIGAKVRVIFMYNTAGQRGGAVYVKNGKITVGAE